MIKSLTQLGLEYKVKDPYKNYGKLLKAIFETKKEDYSTYAYIDIEKVTLKPDISKQWKEFEGVEMVLSDDNHYNETPMELAKLDILPLTLAQVWDMWIRDDLTLKDWEWIFGIAENIIGEDVPRACFNQADGRAYLDGDEPDNRDDSCGVRSAVRASVSEPFPSSFLSLSEITLNGEVYIKKGTVIKYIDITRQENELKAIRAEHLAVANKISGVLRKLTNEK